jgi:hypothetical protein
VGDLEAAILLLTGIAAFGWIAYRVFGSGAPHAEGSARADLNATGGVATESVDTWRNKVDPRS